MCVRNSVRTLRLRSEKQVVSHIRIKFLQVSRLYSCRPKTLDATFCHHALKMPCTNQVDREDRYKREVQRSDKFGTERSIPTIPIESLVHQKLCIVVYVKKMPPLLP